MATTLLAHRQYPSSELTRLYHQWRRIETACLGLESTILGGRDHLGASALAPQGDPVGILARSGGLPGPWRRSR